MIHTEGTLHHAGSSDRPRPLFRIRIIIKGGGGVGGVPLWQRFKKDNCVIHDINTACSLEAQRP